MPWLKSSSTPRSSERGPRLLDGATLAALQGLSLPTRRARGALPGMHAGSQPGRGEDFFQHRAYVRGEDLRTIDWRASARTGHLLVKERHRPLRQPLAVLVDASASMAFPPVSSKVLCARRLGAALTALALRRGDPVTVFGLTEAGFRAVGRAIPAGRSAEIAEELLWRVPDHGKADVLSALAALKGAPLSGSHLIVLSDLYGDETRLLPALGALGRAGVAVTLVHVLSRADRALPERAPALEDAETSEERAIAPGDAAGFISRVEAWSGRLAEVAARAGTEWVAARAELDAGHILRGWLSR